MSFLVVPKASATFFFDFNGFYFSDNLKEANTNTYSRMFYDVTLGFSIDKAGFYQVGWDYVGHSTSDKDASATVTYTATQMGPRFVFYLDKKRFWRTSLAYNLVSSATYNDGTTPTTWRGSALVGDFGYQLPIGESSALGLRINYSQASYSETLVGGTTYTKVSYSRTLIYPSLAITFEF